MAEYPRCADCGGRVVWAEAAAPAALLAAARGVLAAALAVAAAGCGGAVADNRADDRAGDPANAAPRPVLVSAAASLSDVMADIAAAFEQAHGVPVRLNVAGSQLLTAQIIEGAPVDLFVSADARQMDRAQAAGRIDPARRVDLLSNRLVVVVPADRPGRVTGPSDLADRAIRRIALGDPEAVPAGVYARRYLEAQGCWAAVADRIVPAGSVRAALRAVEAGTVDAGIVYRTDAADSTGAVVAFAAPLPDGPPIVYPAAVVADAPNPAGAARLLAYLRSRPARRRFEAAGFIPLPSGGGPPPTPTGRAAEVRDRPPSGRAAGACDG